jgi:N-acyl-D-amino-acid deacylase
MRESPRIRRLVSGVGKQRAITAECRRSQSRIANGGAMLDILIRGGTVIDGTGRPARRADVAIAADRIEAIDLFPGAGAARVIDASGQVVAPGFVDMHSHADFVLPGLPTAESKVHQGFTVEVVGNCGASPAPLTPARRQEVIDSSGLTLPALAWDWTSFRSYLDGLGRQGLSINVAPLVGHGTVRLVVMGSGDGRPTADQLQAMAFEVRRAMDEGAVGFSTGLIYAPGVFADTDELVALTRVAGEAGGFYASHIRGEGETLLTAISEAIDIGRRASVPVEVSHLKAAGRSNWPQMAQAIELIEAARAEGLDVTADMYPYPAGSTALSALLPAWVHAGGREPLLARLSDPADHARIRAALDGPGMARDAGWEGIAIAGCPARPEYEGQTLAGIAASLGVSPGEAVIEILRQAKGDVDMVLFMMSEENVALGLQRPWVMIGSDGEGRAAQGPYATGKPHPRNYGTCPRFLGHYVRDRGLLSLPEAIRKMTSLPATKLGLRDRGRLEPGAVADVVVFDPATIADTATFAEPHRYPRGIPWVLVNGEPVIARGQHTGSRPGRVLAR